jgi:hypothetical protein
VRFAATLSCGLEASYEGLRGEVDVFEVSVPNSLRLGFGRFMSDGKAACLANIDGHGALVQDGAWTAYAPGPTRASRPDARGHPDEPRLDYLCARTSLGEENVM